MKGGSTIIHGAQLMKKTHNSALSKLSDLNDTATQTGTDNKQELKEKVSEKPKNKQRTILQKKKRTQKEKNSLLDKISKEETQPLVSEDSTYTENSQDAQSVPPLQDHETEEVPLSKLSKNDTDGDTQFNYEDFDAKTEKEDELLIRKEKKEESKISFLKKAGVISLVLGCVYLIFLCYGAINTRYVYNADGIKVPQALTIKEITELKEYENVAEEYRQLRHVYEQILLLDYRMAAANEDLLLLGPEYQKMLEQIEVLTIQCKARTVSSQYVQLHAAINKWISTDIAVYCQNMSKAISQNDPVAGKEAIAGRKYVYNAFANITVNLVTIGSQIVGAEYEDIKSWSPQNFISDAISLPTL